MADVLPMKSNLLIGTNRTEMHLPSHRRIRNPTQEMHREAC